MKQKLLYIFLTIVATFCYSLEAGAENVETRIITIDKTNLDNVSNNYFSYEDKEFGTIKLGNGTSNISYEHYSGWGRENWFLKIGKNVTHSLVFSGGLCSNRNYKIQLKKVALRMTSYGTGGNRYVTLTSVSTGGNTVKSVRSAGVNPQQQDNYYSTVELAGEDLGLSFTLNVDNNNDYFIDKIEITYTKEKLHNVTIANNIDAVTTTIQAGVVTTASVTAGDKAEYEFVSWNLPSSGVTLANNTTINNKTIQINATEDGKTITAKYEPLPVFYFAATSPSTIGGTATAEITSSVRGTSLTQTSAKSAATFTASANAGYEFQGWGTSESSSTYESSANPYNLEVTNSVAGETVTKTLYAIFKPVFNFSASATSSNETLGTVTAAVGNAKILGNVDATQESTTATFTASPADDCVFKGWYEAEDYSGEPVSTNTTYTVTLTNSEIGSTATKILYALFKKKQNLQWANADIDLNLVNGQDYSTAATVKSGKTITYTSSNQEAITVDTDGTIHAIGLGNSRITASVEDDDIYQPETIERVFSVGEKKQATFTPAWGDGTSTDIKVDGSTSIGLTNIANDETFTVSASPEGIISWNREGNTLTISAVKAGTATLTLSQQGSDVLAGNQVAYTITVSKYPNTLTLADETKAMKVDDVWKNVVTAVGNDNTTVSYSTEGIASYDAATNKITALAEGSTVITFTQAATDLHEGITKAINVTVTKIANTLSVSLDNHELDVDGTLNLKITGQVNASDIRAEITDVQLSSGVNEGTEVITFDNNIITAHNAGTAKIKFTQEATAKYTSYESETYTITVNKISNIITVTLDGEQKNSKNVGRGVTVNMGLTSTSGSGDFQFTRISGTDDIATINATSIVSGQTDGTSIWEVSQAETYKYAASSTTIRVKVNSVAEEEGYVLEDLSEHEWGTISSYTPIRLSGPGETLSFEASKSWGGANYFFVLYSTDDGNNWTTRANPDLSNQWQPFSFDIPENATHVKFESRAGATLGKYVRNIRVTRKTYVRATATQTNLGEVYTDKTASASFNVSYSSTNGGNIEIISNNPRFKVDTENIEVRKAAFGLLPDPLADTQSITVDNNSDNVSDPVVVTVTYTPDPGHLGNDEGTFTISDRYYSAELTFTAFAKKYETSIGRGSNQATVTDVDGTIDNAFAFTGTSAATPSANSNDDFYYTITSTYTSDVHTDEGVITYDPATNTITGRNAGTAKLTIYQKSTDNYAALSQTFEFSVNKLENPVSIALSTVSLEVDGEAAVQLTKDDGKGALSVAYSNIAYTNESMNREGGFLSYNAENETLTAINAGTATVTVTQAETYKYLSKSKQFAVTVDKLMQTLSWDREVETSLQIGAVIEGNTATSAQELSPVTYTSSNTAAIEVDGDTGKLTAKAVGSNITITASQAGNYKYAPATITRQFSVFNKQAPAFIPDEACYDSSTKTITVKWEGSTTISVTGVGSEAEAGFTITNGNDAVISVVRNESTITITGLSIGNTTLTLAQAANDDFLGKSETYTINVVMPSDYLTLDPSAGFDLAEGGEYSKIFLKRAIPAGLNTIALPFNTTASALGAQKAYSFVNVGVKEDGAYYFYFKELAADETLLAGVPYVILCENAISELVISDKDGISVSSTEELQRVGTVNCGQWSFVANFGAGEDGSGIDMNGKYGVVNSAEPKRNEIMLGGEGSKLQAYTAYFILNQASPSSYTSGAPASTKVASADIPAGAIPLFSIKE